MKKVFALVLVLCMMLTCAMAESIDLTGMWSISHAEMNGVTLGAETLGQDMTIELREDKNVVITMNGQSGAGTWRVEGDQLLLNNGKEDMVFTVTETGFYTVQEPVTIHFAKIDAAPVVGDVRYEDAPAAVAAADISDFNGEWGNPYLFNEGRKVPLSLAGATSSMKITDGLANIDLNGSVATVPVPFENGVLTISANNSTLTITLHEGNVASLNTNGSVIYYDKLN